MMAKIVVEKVSLITFVLTADVTNPDAKETYLMGKMKRRPHHLWKEGPKLPKMCLTALGPNGSGMGNVTKFATLNGANLMAEIVKVFELSCQKSITFPAICFHFSAVYLLFFTGVDPVNITMPNCPAEFWVNNGKCDDEVNIPECDYDGGDCCLEPYVQGFCTICVCYDD